MKRFIYYACQIILVIFSLTYLLDFTLTDNRIIEVGIGILMIASLVYVHLYKKNPSL